MTRTIQISMLRNAPDRPRQYMTSLQQLADVVSEHVHRWPNLTNSNTVSHTACKVCHELTESEQGHHLVNHFDTRKCDTLQPRGAAEMERVQRAASSQCRDINQPRAPAESKRVQGAASS